MLRESGYRQRQDAKELTLVDVENGVEFFYLRPRDIALYVGEGTLDVGITGRDLLLDSGAKAEEVLGLGFGRSTFRFAGPGGAVHRPRRAPGHADRHVVRRDRAPVPRRARDRGDREPPRRGGRDQRAARRGRRDRRRRRDRQHAGQGGARDVRRPDPGVRGGADHARQRDARRARRVPAPAGGRDGRAQLRDDGLRHPRRSRSAEAVALTPGIESPTVSPLHREGWVAVRAMVPRAGAHRVMDELWTIGARGILVTDIHACRL